jgi:prepilin-type N-terminal cleavage/methylation domain-containing protein
MKNRGFTLIELLVVISIILLLSSVVMASLNQSRVKAQEATIKQTLQSIKTQAELEHSKTGDYSTVENAIAPMLAHINKNGGTATTTYSNQYGINEGYKRYAVSVKFNSDPTKNWSVSDSGNVVIWDKTNTKFELDELNYWNDAKTACANSGGRLPTIEELRAIWSAHGTTLPNMTSYMYWSSTGYEGGSDFAWFIFGTNGSINIADKTLSTFLVRCVR